MIKVKRIKIESIKCDDKIEKSLLAINKRYNTYVNVYNIFVPFIYITIAYLKRHIRAFLFFFCSILVQ